MTRSARRHGNWSVERSTRRRGYRSFTTRPAEVSTLEPSDLGIARCWLRDAAGDALHAVLCAAGFNLRCLLRAMACGAIRSIRAIFSRLLARPKGDGLGAPAPWRGWIEALGDMIVLRGRSFGLGQAQTLWMTAPREGLNNPPNPRDFAAGRPKSRQSGRNSTFCRAARRVSPFSGRTYPAAGIKRRRDIHRFDSANSVSTWAAFFAMPR
jgi:hypothetical protein